MLSKKDKDYNEDIQQFAKLQTECFELFKNKNKDYARAYAKYGLIGVLIRLNDKIARYVNISETKIVLVKDEKIRNILTDVANYCIMGVMILDRKDAKHKKNK